MYLNSNQIKTILCQIWPIYWDFLWYSVHFRCPMLIKSRYTCTWFYYDTMIVTVNGFEMLLRYWTSGFEKYCTSAVYTSYFPVPPPSYCTLQSSITLMQGKSYMPTTMPLFHLQRPTLTPNFFILVFNSNQHKGYASEIISVQTVLMALDHDEGKFS